MDDYLLHLVGGETWETQMLSVKYEKEETVHKESSSLAIRSFKGKNKNLV